MKSHARVVVIGGGTLGVGLLYHLALEGWSDCVLVEKGELTSGSTWHAAGLIPHFIGSLNMAKIHNYGVELYRTIEAETGQSAGWHGCGAIRLARTDEEVDWFRYVQGVLNLAGAESHLIGQNEIKALHPFMEVTDVRLGFYTPNDGHTDPTSATNAMAAGARKLGAEIYRHTLVTGLAQRPGGEWEVITDKGTIVAEHVVNAAGSFAPQVGSMAGLRLPIVNMIHQYLVTEPIPEMDALDKELPVVRDPLASSYYRQEQRSLLIGPYEMENAQAWGVDGIDWSFDMELLPPDLDRLATSLDHAMERLPVLKTAGIRRVVSGPITHTPDGGFLMGPAPGLRNHWLCCGASIGITQGPGAGKYLAQWMVHGQAEINVLELDPRRYGDWALGDYLLDTSIDEYQQMYQCRPPGEFREAGRPVRSSPLYGTLKAKGAQFGTAFGWERAKWFSTDGVPEAPSFRRTNWFEPVREECRAVRQQVGILDLSSFAKFDVSGPDAMSFLNRICANRMPGKVGGVVLAHPLTEDGVIEGEMTITRLADDLFYVLSAATAEVRDFDRLTQGLQPGENVTIENVTDDFGVLVLSGPKSRDLLSRITDADLSNAAFPWLSGKEIEAAGVGLRAIRISYVGELGWELHAPMASLPAVYDALWTNGEAFGLKDFGLYAMNALRMEKGYKAWGSELTNEISLFEADMARFVRLDKDDFVGRDALLARRDKTADLTLVYVTVDARDADPIGNEPIYDGERIVGVSTSAAYGYTIEKTVAFAYVDPGYTAPGTELEILILGERRSATVLPGPLYDPDNARLRA